MLKKIKNSGLVKIILVLIICLVTSINSFGWIVANSSGEAFVPPESNILNDYIIEGGSAFLKAFSDILEFMSIVEKQNFDDLKINELLKIIEGAAFYMGIAQENYVNLEGLADVTPLSEEIIDGLVKFPYWDFKNSIKANDIVFQIVQQHLENGDIRSVYSHIRTMSSDILNLLVKIKFMLSTESMIDISDLWELNQNCSDFLLFGQYVAGVFSELLILDSREALQKRGSGKIVFSIPPIFIDF
jgi:hypothetical protein